MAVLIFIFIFKFIFSSNDEDTSGLIQIDRTHEPELFKLIDEVVNHVETEQPKKVFLSSEVNAFVTYNSSFWSMFLPVKKNLTVGLGLINTTTVSELKAILAHEFGHFSQRSMKVGSFVNQAHRIIHDMLYNNEGMEKIVTNFASFHGILYFFAKLAILVINGIQWVLAKTYDLLFIKHMSLSRQMEFNADAIATYVVGSEVKSSALLRLDLSESAFQNSFSFYLNEKISADTKNLYENQSILLNYLSQENNHEVKNCLPYIHENEINRYNKSKLKIEDQWSSHPTIQQRVLEIKRLAIPSESKDNRLAAHIIKNFTHYGEKFTNRLFELASIKRTTNYISPSEFLTQYKELVQENTFSKVFNNYYDYKNPVLKGVEKISHHAAYTGNLKSDVFSDEKTSFVYEKNALENDAQILEMIGKGTYAIKTFDYDGSRYTKHQSGKVHKIVQDRLNFVHKKIEENDFEIFQFCYSKSNDDQKKRYIELQGEFNKTDEEFDLFQKAFEDFLPHIQFMSENHQIEAIPKLRAKLLENEKSFKMNVEKLFSSSFGNYMTGEHKKLLQDYVRLPNLYFNLGEYLNHEVNMLNEVLGAYQQILSLGYFKIKKNFLDFKSEVIEQN